MLLALLGASCSYRTDSSVFETPGGAPFAVVDSRPRPDHTDVALSSTIIVTFSDWPDPASVSQFGSISIRSGANSYDFQASVDLLQKMLILRPRSAFTPNTQYALVLGKGLQSLRGVPLAEGTIRFTTGSTPGGSPFDPPPPTPRTLAADVQPLLDASCGGPGCHGSSEPQVGLDLSSVGRSASLLVGTPAAEVRLLRVKPGDPSTSYLLRKLLATPDVVGAQMPLGSALDDPTLHVFSDWIATGAN